MSQTHTANWMRKLAEHYHSVRAAFPDDRLIVLFDVDGTIVDARHTVVGLLREYDKKHHSTHFKDFGLKDVEVNEDEIDLILSKIGCVSDKVRSSVAAWYRSRYWEPDVVLRSHRPFAGVMEVMHCFQMQPNTEVGINTARPERLRLETLHSLNHLGREFQVVFRDELLFMSSYLEENDAPSSKCTGIRYFLDLGYRVVAFIDNEPENLEAVAGMAESDGILLLHADTLFKSARSRLPRATVSGYSYDISELAMAQPVAVAPVGDAAVVAKV